MTAHELIEWDEESPEPPLTYDEWEERRIQKREACLVALRPMNNILDEIYRYLGAMPAGKVEKTRAEIEASPGTVRNWKKTGREMHEYLKEWGRINSVIVTCNDQDPAKATIFRFRNDL